MEVVRESESHACELPCESTLLSWRRSYRAATVVHRSRHQGRKAARHSYQHHECHADQGNGDTNGEHEVLTWSSLAENAGA